MAIKSMTYFRNVYGAKQSVTIFHRMRTWYNHKAKAAMRDKDTVAYERHMGQAAVMTAYIKAARHVWL